MEKNTYSAPKADVLEIEKEDVITTSPIVLPPYIIGGNGSNGQTY